MEKSALIFDCVFAFQRAVYLRAAGKPAKLALTAVMRKLFILLNHLLKKPDLQLAT